MFGTAAGVASKCLVCEDIGTAMRLVIDVLNRETCMLLQRDLQTGSAQPAVTVIEVVAWGLFDDAVLTNIRNRLQKAIQQ